MTIKVCYITAYLDIRRVDWDIWEKRSNDIYLEGFYRLLPLFAKSQEHEIIVYLDRKLIEQVRTHINQNYDENLPIYIVPIDEEYLRTYSVLWRRLPRETEIMQSDSFRKLLQHRLEYPECSQPKYNMINDSKIDLVMHSMHLTKAPILVWVDFAYTKHLEVLPERLLDPCKLDLDRMNFSLVDHIRESDFNLMETLVNPREVLEAGFFASSRDVLLRYQKLFHEVHQTVFHDNNITDDDIHVVLQCIKQQPDLFHLHYQGHWLQSLKHFQIQEIRENGELERSGVLRTRAPPRNASVYVELCGGIGNQLFQIATAYAASRRTNTRLYLLQTPNYDKRQGSLPNKYANSLYRKLKIVQSLEKPHVLVQEKQWTYSDIMPDVTNVLSQKTDVLLKGYFQSEDYFIKHKQEIRELFSPEEGSIAFLEKQEENVFAMFPELHRAHDYCLIHVRRGDYITYAYEHNPCDMNYFNQAMSVMSKERYYITSDDLEWCKQNFIGDKYRFFEIKDDLTQLFAMTLFKNYIISNSSYAWWGSYLSIYPKSFIIAPSLWIGGPNASFDSYSSIYRKEMLVISRLVKTS